MISSTPTPESVRMRRECLGYWVAFHSHCLNATRPSWLWRGSGVSRMIRSCSLFFKKIKLYVQGPESGDTLLEGLSHVINIGGRWGLFLSSYSRRTISSQVRRTNLSNKELPSWHLVQRSWNSLSHGAFPPSVDIHPSIHQNIMRNVVWTKSKGSRDVLSLLLSSAPNIQELRLLLWGLLYSGALSTKSLK